MQRNLVTSTLEVADPTDDHARPQEARPVVSETAIVTATIPIGTSEEMNVAHQTVASPESDPSPPIAMVVAHPPMALLPLAPTERDHLQGVGQLWKTTTARSLLLSPAWSA